MTTPRHFIDLDALDSATIRGILDQSRALKEARAGLPRGTIDQGKPLAGRVLAMLFERPSTRTRVSFDVAMRQLGGETLILSAQELQLKRGETMADTARVLSRYVDAIMIRCASHASIEELVEHATVPVINGLTDWSHPCQIMADLLTFEEHKGPIAGRTVAWLGDGNNVARSWVHAAARLDFTLKVATPAERRLGAKTEAWAAAAGAKVEFTTDPAAVVAGADLVVTDTWVSMGDDESERRHNIFAPFTVDQRVMDQAGPEAIFMHCLPAHRGEEVTAEVLDGPRSVVWDEAENRLHAQKGVLAWCLADA